MKNEKKDSILLVTLSSSYGGGARHTYELAQGLKDRYNLYLACPREKPYWEKFNDLVGKKNICKLPAGKFSFWSILKLRKFCLKKGIKLIHSHGRGAGIYTRFLRLSIPLTVVHTFHGLHFRHYTPFKRNFYLNIENQLASVTNRFIAVSQSEKEDAALYFRLDQDMITVTENGVEKKESRVSFRNDPFKVLFVGRFTHPKNPLAVLQIAEKLKEQKNICITMVGDGELFDKIKAKADSMGLSNISFKGYQKDISPFVNDSQLLLSTSLWEGLPYTLLEACASGLPVVATNCTGNKDAVRDGQTGYLFEQNDHETACSKIIELSQDQEKWEGFSREAVQLYKDKFTLERMIEHVASVYDELLEEV